MPPLGAGGVGLYPWAQSPALLRRCSSVLNLPSEDEREGDSEEEGFASDVSLPYVLLQVRAMGRCSYCVFTSGGTIQSSRST